MIIEGRAWVFGDQIDTDVLAPGYALKLGPEGMAKHCLEAIDPDFAPNVKPGDIVVGGANFGLGSSREQAAQALATLGIGAVLAKSFARIFYRNAINIGLPVLTIDPAMQVDAGEILRLDIAEGTLTQHKAGQDWSLQPMPPHILDILNAGGLMAQLKAKMAG